MGACNSQLENTPGQPRATFNLKILLDTRVRQSIRKYSWTPACDIQLENSPWPPRATVNLKILLDTCVQQSIRKYSLTPSWTVNMKILLDIHVTVTFQRAFQPSAGLSYRKIRTRQKCV